jgi:hypothetical protein
VYNVLVSFGIAALVGDVPTERSKERVDELDAELLFFVATALVVTQIELETVDEFFDNIGSRHKLF